MKQYHCQICARHILLLKNKSDQQVIAHHGYQRPGEGWQTASCFGARELPYEVSCDALPPYIRMVAGYLERGEYRLHKLRTEPPEILFEMIKVGSAWKDGFHIPATTKTFELKRPENFDPVKQEEAGSAIFRTYENVWMGKLWQYKADVTSATGAIRMASQRLFDHPKYKPEKYV